MAEMILAKVGQGLFKAAPESDGEAAKIGDGELFKVTWSRPRDLVRHRKFFGLLKVAFENQDQYATPEQFRHVVLIELGWADPVITAAGDIHWIVRSMSFSNMDQSEFDRLYSQTLDLMVRKFVIGTDPRELSRAAEEVMRFL